MTEADAMAVVMAVLTPNLLKPHYRRRVAAGAHPMTGHCYVASEAIYHLLGGRLAGYQSMYVEHEGEPHWWVRSRTGAILDVTAAQYRTPVPYRRSRVAAFLTPLPSKRARIVLARISRYFAQHAADA